MVVFMIFATGNIYRKQRIPSPHLWCLASHECQIRQFSLWVATKALYDLQPLHHRILLHTTYWSHNKHFEYNATQICRWNISLYIYIDISNRWIPLLTSSPVATFFYVPQVNLSVIQSSSYKLVRQSIFFGIIGRHLTLFKLLCTCW